MENKRTTIYDIASELNTTASTVTRALNGKPGVGEALRSRILEKAAEMGYRTNRLAKSLTRGKMRIGMVVVNHVQDFHGMVIQGAKCEAERLVDYNVECETRLLSCDDACHRVAQELRRMVQDGFDGIIFTPNEYYGYDDIIDELADSAVAVGTVIVNSGHPGVAFSVFPACTYSGRMAADLFHLGQIRQDESIAILTGFEGFSNHMNCVEGFQEQNGRYRMRIAGVWQHHDDAQTAYSLTRELLRKTPSIRGIYCGTATTGPVCKAVCELEPNDRPMVIGTEITDDSIRYLNNGTLMATMFQDPFQQGKRAVRAMYEHLEGLVPSLCRKIQIHPEVVMPGNLEMYSGYFGKDQA